MTESLSKLVEWAKTYDQLLGWLFAGSMALFLLTPIVVAWIVVQLPKEYFTSKRRRRTKLFRRYPTVRPAILAAKNVLGVVLALAGVVMLVMPGQGLLTLLAGMMLMDFPGKFRLERWLATRPPVWKSINWLRKCAGREPLRRPESAE